MGHHVEFEDKALLAAAKSWVKSRASGEQQPLSQLVKGSSYDSNEIALPDKFIDPYVGKIYPSSTEVFSMGLQHFTDKESMLDLLKRDREHILLIVGAIHGRV